MDQYFKIENWLNQNAYDVFINEVEIEDKFKKCLKKSKLSNRIKNKLEYNVEIMKEFTKVASAKNVLETTW